MGNYSRQLSVIVPVYRGKAFIAETISEILKIQCTLEVIVVDDGSPDDSFEYCAEVFAGNDQIRLFRKENGGIVSARNYGMQQALGKYCLFVDQDDLVDPKVVSQAVEDLEQVAGDMLIWSTRRLLEQGETSECDTVLCSRLYNGEEIQKELLKEMLTNQDNRSVSYLGHVWAGIYRRRFVNDNQIRFHKFVDIEDDYLFVFDCLRNADKVRTLDRVGYYWRYNPTSETYRLKYIPDILEKYDAFYGYLMGKIRPEWLTDAFLRRYQTYIVQDVIVRSVENTFVWLNRNLSEKKALEQRYRDRISFFREVSVVPYEKRRKRIFRLLQCRLFRVAAMYVYLDSIYRTVKKKLENSV